MMCFLPNYFYTNAIYIIVYVECIRFNRRPVVDTPTIQAIMKTSCFTRTGDIVPITIKTLAHMYSLAKKIL